ncbi:MAG TPA: hypothetical protein PK854_10515 [Oscillospiraceae bacterium]|nr:hypothetical protein [Oscillospiraceae bacterium]HPS35683.1 hypothetical protein [Oscillospiraceae bacterium]
MKHNNYRDAIQAVKLSEDFNDKTIAMLESKTKPVRKFRLRPALAACLAVLLLGGGSSAFAIAAEVKEYNAALTFFAQNNLSTEGLARGEIKNVYRDITTGKFAYDKTAEVIEKSVTGYQISQNAPTPEDVEALWNYKNINGNYYNIPLDTGEYRYNYVQKFDKSLEMNVPDKVVFGKYDGDTLLWKAELPDFSIRNYTVYGDYIVLFGMSESFFRNEISSGRLALLDKNGQVLWDIHADNGNNGGESYEKVVCDDSGITVFGNARLPITETSQNNDQTSYYAYSKNVLEVIRYDYSGKVIRHTEKEVGTSGIMGAAKLGDGYLVQLLSSTDGQYLLKVESDGTFTDKFTYSAQDSEYFITDMFDYNGKIYLSAYSVPKLGEGEETAGGRYDIAGILNPIFAEEDFDISNEELTKRVRANFTAVLLVCDPETGVPGEFYSVEGSIGSKLSKDEKGQLIWKVERITDTFLSMMTSSFTIGGACNVYEYAFDETGTLVSQVKTEEVTPFRR